MLENSVLVDKPEITVNGKNLIDLFPQGYQIPKGSLNINLIKVSSEYIARPDLLSIAIYGSDSYGDLLMKLNNISNPLELNENMVLVCPVPAAMAQIKFANVQKSEIIEEDTVTLKKSDDSTTTITSPSQANVPDKRYDIDYKSNKIYY